MKEKNIIEEAKKKGKDFCKKNWPYLLGTAATVAMGMVAWKVVKISGVKSPEVNDFLKPIEGGYKGNSWIDEDIFTDLAPQIEDALLEEGLDELLIDRTYPVKFPKFGDFKNGTYSIDKNIQVHIRTMK